MEIFFLGLPGWFIASLLYLISSKLVQHLMIKERTVNK